MGSEKIAEDATEEKDGCSDQSQRLPRSLTLQGEGDGNVRLLGEHGHGSDLWIPCGALRARRLAIFFELRALLALRINRFFGRVLGRVGSTHKQTHKHTNKQTIVKSYRTKVVLWNRAEQKWHFFEISLA